MNEDLQRNNVRGSMHQGNMYGMRRTQNSKYSDSKNGSYSPSSNYNYMQNGQQQRPQNQNYQNQQTHRRYDKFPNNNRRDSSGVNMDRIFKQNDIIIKLLKEIRDRLPPQKHYQPAEQEVQQYNDTEHLNMYNNGAESSHEVDEMPVVDQQELEHVNHEEIEDQQQSPQ